MHTAHAPIRSLMGAITVAALMALYGGCASNSVSTHQEGGGSPPPVPEAGLSEGTSPSDAPVPWCAAYHIINCVCQQCHQNPPLNGAPIPLMTYDDTQAPFGTKELVWQVMQDVVSSRFMPFTGDPTVMPVVLPLDDDDYNTMLAWLGQGATDLGGQDCPMECDWSKGPPPGR
jgi:hypothetical protein